MIELEGAALPLLCVLILLSACGGERGTAPSPGGSIKVTAATTGVDIDLNGYTIRVGPASQAVGPNASANFSGLDPGDYTVELARAASNCIVTGENPRRVTLGPGQAASTNFEVGCTAAVLGRIAFTSDRAGAGVRVMNSDGSNVEGVGGMWADEAAWSPDGTRIAFTGRRDGDPYTRVYVMNADGSNSYNLTDGVVWDGAPAWSRDGTRMTFTTLRDGNAEVYVMNADGSDPVNITRSPAVDAGSVWSPDGTRIAFVTTRDGKAEVYVMNPDGSNPVNLTRNPAGDGDPAWSPDGKQIAFASDRDGNFEIYVMNADGSNPVRLTHNLAVDVQPTWSPDGNRIAFTSDREGVAEIYVMNSDGSKPVNLTNNPAADLEPDWSPR